MNKICALLILLLLVTTAHAGDFHPEVNAELEKEKFWADVDFVPDSTVTVTEFRAWFEATADKVFLVLFDTNNFAHVHGNYKDASVITKSAFDAVIAARPSNAEALGEIIGDRKVPSEKGRVVGGKWMRYEYLNFNFPWPLSNRWTVQRADVDETQAAHGYYRYDYKMSVGNFKTLKGYWELVPVAGKPDWTEFRGRYESDPGIVLPKFVTKTAAKTGLKRDVDDNRKILRNK